MDDDLAVLLLGEFADAAFDVAHRDLRRSEVDDLVLVRLAHVEDEDVFLRVEFALELFDCDLRNAVDDGVFADGLIARDFQWADLAGRRDAAELVVVDQFGDGRVGCRRPGTQDSCAASVCGSSCRARRRAGGGQ